MQPVCSIRLVTLCNNLTLLQRLCCIDVVSTIRGWPSPSSGCLFYRWRPNPLWPNRRQYPQEQAYLVIAYLVMTYLVMTYLVMTCVVMAYILMASRRGQTLPMPAGTSEDK